MAWRPAGLDRLHFENCSHVGLQSGNAPIGMLPIRTARLRFPKWTRFRVAKDRNGVRTADLAETPPALSSNG